MKVVFVTVAALAAAVSAQAPTTSTLTKYSTSIYTHVITMTPISYPASTYPTSTYPANTASGGFSYSANSTSYAVTGGTVSVAPTSAKQPPAPTQTPNTGDAAGLASNLGAAAIAAGAVIAMLF